MKLILRLAILVFLFSNLAACSNDGAPGSNGTNPNNSKPSNPTTGNRGDDRRGETIEPNGCSQVSLPPYPKFVSISTLYPNPAELLTTSDPVSALYRLKQIASPTEEYHRELYQLATAARSLDAAHLLLLVRASYFTASDLRQMQAEITATTGKTDTSSCTRRQSAWRDFQQSQLTKFYAIMTLTTGLSMMTKAVMSWDEALELIHEILPDADPGTVQMIVERFRPLNEARVRELMRLADELSLRDSAGEFAFEWFQNYSDRRFETLISTAAQLHYQAKDVLLLKGVETFKRFTLPQIFQLIEASDYRVGVMAAKAIAKIDLFNHERVLQILAKISSEESRGQFLRAAINLYSSLTTSELKALINSASSDRNEIAVAAVAKVSDVNFENVHSVAGLLSGQWKDQWILPSIEKLNKVTTSQLLTLIDDAYYDGLSVAKALHPKVSDLDLKQVLAICGKFNGSNRDEWLSLATPAISQLSTDEVVQVMDAAYYTGFMQAKALLPKISDFNFESIFTINSKLNGSNRDEWIQLVLPRFKSLRASEVAQLMDGAYYKAFEIAKGSLAKLSDFGVPAILLLIEKMNGQNRDSWLDLTLPKLGKVSTAQALDLVEAAYYSGSKAAQALLTRITDLTVHNAIQLTEKLSGQNRDELLLKAVDLVTDLNRSNLKELASAAYYAEKEVIKKGEKRLGSR